MTLTSAQSSAAHLEGDSTYPEQTRAHASGGILRGSSQYHAVPVISHSATESENKRKKSRLTFSVNADRTFTVEVDDQEFDIVPDTVLDELNGADDGSDASRARRRAVPGLGSADTVRRSYTVHSAGGRDTRSIAPSATH